jgi:hypothetical protein
MDNHVKTSISWSKEKYNIELIELSEKEKAGWNAPLKSIIDKWIEGAKAKGLPAEAVVDDIKMYIKNHSGT